MAKIRVLIADDHTVLRAGLKVLLIAQPDLEVIGEAASGPEAVALARELKPDVITLDLTMPGGSGPDIIRQLRVECPTAKVLVLTMHDDAAYCRAALDAGALGYIVKTAADTELIVGIREVAQGKKFLQCDTLRHAEDLQAKEPRSDAADQPSPSLEDLSFREREVLGLLVRGFTNQEVADRLFVSVKTAETYRGRISEKLHLKSRAELVQFALNHGLLR
ncbi:MAG TPA: response regulator transcription factor [Pirellulales bacterium]|nr:response regulator transcription factor [Pirellulales bacterium]